MNRSPLHPATRIASAALLVLAVRFLPLPLQGIIVFAGAIFAWGVTKKTSAQDPGALFLKLWITSAFFLLIIHAVNLAGGPIFRASGVSRALDRFFLIGSLMAAFLWLIRTLRGEELFGFLLKLGIPPAAVYSVFQVFYLAPRIRGRAGDILIAQQARGLVLTNFVARTRALAIVLIPLISSMIEELEHRTAAIYARGLYLKVPKTHLSTFSFGIRDLMAICGMAAFFTLCMIVGKLCWL
jgi:energy-coupling factor transporter transmembrane protein EcfT